MRVPPHFSPKFFFLQNDSEWLEMDFKLNFIKCNILTCETPPQCPLLGYPLEKSKHL